MYKIKARHTVCNRLPNCKKIYILVWSDILQSRNWINKALHALRRAETEQKTKKVNAAGQRAVASVSGEVVNHPNIEFSEEGL